MRDPKPESLLVSALIIFVLLLVTAGLLTVAMVGVYGAR